MSLSLIHFFTPVVNENHFDGFPSIVNFAEAYLNIGIRCYQFVSVKNNGTIVVTPSELPKHLWYHIVLKIVSVVISFGIFPLAMLLIKSVYRAYHPLLINHEPQKTTPSFIPSISLLEKQPITILKKIFTEFLFSPIKCLQYAVVSKHFNTTINEHFIGWENAYKKMVETISQPELDAFLQRVKKLYTSDREPSFKEKVHYLCQELWEDASQIRDIQILIKDQKLTSNHLLEPFHYNRLKRITQLAKNAGLVAMVLNMKMDKDQKISSLHHLLSSENFKNGDLKQKAHLIREWFGSQKDNQELEKIIEIKMTSKKTSLLSVEMLDYMARMPNLHTLDVRCNHFSILPKNIGNLTQLQTLIFNENNIVTIPETIGNLTQLETLEFTSNKIESLPHTIGNLTQLKSLYLKGNRLSYIPNFIWNLSQLEQLSFCHNQISVLSEDIQKLNRLEILYLHNNNLTIIPDAVENLKQLKTLDLSNNSLIYTPESIKNFIKKEERSNFLFPHSL